MATPPEVNERRIAAQLPVISPQRESLAAVLLTRWLRRAAPHGLAALYVTRHRGRERWALSWHTPTRHPKMLQARTLAALYVALQAEMTQKSGRAGPARRHGKARAAAAGTNGGGRAAPPCPR